MELSLNPRLTFICAGALLTQLVNAQSQPKTPYPGEPSVSEVSRIRVLSDHTRKLRNFQPRSDSAAQTVFEAGIGYCEGDQPIDQGTLVEGSSSSGFKSIRMGDIQSFSVTQIGNQTIRLKLSVMPIISEQTLLSERPSYTTLSEKYGYIISIDIPRYQHKAKACIIGKLKEYVDDRVKIVLLEDTILSHNFGLLYDANKIWWAIPSVIADSEYPLRVGLSAFDGIIKLKDH